MSVERLFESAPSHWRLTTLGELAKSSGGDIQTGPFGSQLHASDYVVDGIPSIMPKNISTDSVLTDDIARVSPEDIKRLAKYKVQVGDIVYSRRGDVEKCARITPREDGWLCGTGCLRVRVLPAEVSTEYLHAYLCHPSVREWIVRHAVGATMPNLNTSILSALPVYIPSEAEMNFIAATWLSISEKIQLNRQINQTLEQMAQAIFQSWFVDFEPVKAKIAAREDWLARQAAQSDAHDDVPQFSSPVCYAHEFADAAASAPATQADLETFMNRAAMCAISGKTDADLDAMPTADYQHLYHTASLFPDELVESELGEIPKGWVVDLLGNSLSVLETGSRPKGGVAGINEGVPSVGAENIIGVGNYSYGKEKFVSREFFEKMKRGKVLDFDFLLYKDGGKPGDFKPRVSMFGCGFPYKEFAINEHVFRIRSEILGQPFLYFLIGHENVLSDLRNKGAKAAIPGINQSDVNSIRFVKPELPILTAFNASAQVFVERILKFSLESLQLSNLRDSLLPKLLSGELDISALTNLAASSDAATGAAHV
ncbi:restriction endonuclease subunit S [Venatoribacter cucullus]|uniref:restriction endonuclease subunit S n=1 Tax=Venatoribacter cucullus TaxID=2661630 RepID=UPI00223F7DC9|nr:restriction endonuclease subunit S [Venatoribacter cucullus]UZK03802.1 restriction endonuclease subunit S [Venatoribacter cucullus]